jgi:hypothetical protein
MKDKTAKNSPPPGSEAEDLFKKLPQEPVFYYSRERRLARAPESVQALYRDDGKKHRGIFRSLTGTRSSAYIFMSIIILSAAMVLVYRVSNRDESNQVEGNELAFSAFRFDDNTFLLITKQRKDSESAYSGNVEIAASPLAQKGETGENSPIHSERIFFTLKEQEEFRLALPFEAKEILLLLQCQDRQYKFTIPVK